MTAQNTQPRSDSASAPSGDPGYRLYPTGYPGNEDAVLRLRNANRAGAKTRRYLDWRYSEPGEAPPSRVFWIESSSGMRVGMAALIFRRYWIDGCPAWLAVLGDISLDTSLRGKGLGRKLLGFVGEWLSQELPGIHGFVIPTDVAGKSLASLEWSTIGSLVPWVYVVDPTARLAGLSRSGAAARLGGRLYKAMMAATFARIPRGGEPLEVVDVPDASFDTFWNEFPKRGLILRDRSLPTLDWRYRCHPDHHFRFAKLVIEGRMSGWLVFEIVEGERCCLVYDVMVGDPRRLPVALRRLVRYCLDVGGVDIVRLVLNDSHPYARTLWGAGFLRRGAQSSVQFKAAGTGRLTPGSLWCLTLNDKDI